MILGASYFSGDISGLAAEVDSIELYIPRMGLYTAGLLRKDLLDELIDKLSTFDLLSSIHAPYYTLSPNYPQDILVDISNMNSTSFRILTESIELASVLDSRAVVVHPGSFTDEREHAYSSMVKNLIALARIAEDNNVMLGLENKEATDKGNLCTSAEEIIRAVEDVNSDNLGMTFDIGHANLTCGGDMVQLARFASSIASHVVHVHVHDNRGKGDDLHFGDEHLAPGDGIIDYRVLKELKGYQGIYNMEVASVNEVIRGKKVLLEAISGTDRA